MVGRLRIFGLNFLFVFRHKWDAKAKSSFYDIDFRDYRLGIWYKCDRMVGSKDFKSPKKWKNNMVNSHMLGLNLVVCKTWVTVDRNGMHMDLEIE